jgi:hypothetical protein
VKTPDRSPRSRWASAAIISSLAAYLWLATRHLILPGLYYDEALQALSAIGMLIGTHGPARWGIEFGGRTLPLMSGGYVGPLKSYALVPAFALGGISVYSLRLTTILIALLGLVYTARVGRATAGPAGAAIAVALAATDPSLILFTRTDWGPVAIAFVLRTASLFYLWQWWTNPRRRSLVIGFALLGLGLYDKASFSWFIAGVAVAGLIGARCDPNRPRLDRRDIVLAALAFFVASAPFWAFNLTHGWATVRQMRSASNRMTHSVSAEIPGRVKALVQMFQGTSTAIWMFGERLPSRLGVSATLLAPLTVGATLVLAWAARASWRFLLLPTLMATMLLAMLLMPRYVWVHHFVSIYPLPHLAIGAAVVALIERSRGMARRLAAGVSCSLVALALAANLIVDAGYRELMLKTGGAAAWSDGIYEAERLLTFHYADRPIHVMGWGLLMQLYLLSGAHLHLSDTFWLAQQNGRVNPIVVDLVRDPSNVFLVPLWSGRGRSGLSILDEAVQITGCVTEKRRRFIKDRGGREVHAVIEFDTRLCSPSIHPQRSLTESSE